MRATETSMRMGTSQAATLAGGEVVQGAVGMHLVRERVRHVVAGAAVPRVVPVTARDGDGRDELDRGGEHGMKARGSAIDVAEVQYRRTCA